MNNKIRIMKNKLFLFFPGLWTSPWLSDPMLTIQSLKHQAGNLSQLSRWTFVLAQIYTGSISESAVNSEWTKLQFQESSRRTGPNHTANACESHNLHTEKLNFPNKPPPKPVTSVWQKDSSLALTELPRVLAEVQSWAWSAWPSLNSASH